MQTFDKHEVIAGFAQYPASILGNLETRDFVLIAMNDLPLSEPSRLDYTARGFTYIGDVGILNGKPRTALYEPLDNDAITALSAAYIRLVEAALKPKDASEEWLKKLWALGDQRGEA